MNKKLFLHSTAIMMAAMLCVSFSSCKNSNNRSENNAEATLSDFSKRSAAAYANYYHAQEREFDQMDEYAPGEDGYDSNASNSQYGMWEHGYLIDDFGETNPSMPYIALVLNNAYQAGYENSSEYRGTITIQVLKQGIDFRCYDDMTVGVFPAPVLIRTETGDRKLDVELYNGEREAFCTNLDDCRFVAQQLKKGNFTIKVNRYIYNVTTETSRFENAYNDFLLN